MHIQNIYTPYAHVLAPPPTTTITTHTTLSQAGLGIHPPDKPPYTYTQIQLLIPRTWHGCQRSPSSPEVINRLFTTSLQTMIEDCWKPLCFHFKPLNSFTRTLIVTSVTRHVCVRVCVCERARAQACVCGTRRRRHNGQRVTEREAARVPASSPHFFPLCRSYEEKPKKNEGVKKRET